MRLRILLILGTLVLAAAFAASPAIARANRVQDAIWNDGNLYGTVVTPTSFVAPPEHSTDTIYSFMMSGLNGQRSISDAAPGDRDYNGGRWTVVQAVFTDEGKDALGDGSGNIAVELTSDEELSEQVENGYIELMPTTTYFECPLLP